MREIILETKEFILEHAKTEISKFTLKKPVLKSSQFILKFDNDNEAFGFVMNVIYFSRTIERIYVNDKEKGLIDLAGFKLTKREYKLNRNKESLNPLIPIFCFYELELDKEDQLKMIDPLAKLGDITIEASIFNPTKALHMQKRHTIPAKDYFKLNPTIPKEEKNKEKNKIVSIVQENQMFKRIKDNLNFIKTKVKLSQYELDWLDVKFKKGDFDYCITYLNDFDDKDELFYMAEFITEKKICVITNEKLPITIPRKFKLKLILEKQIELDDKEYFINIFQKRAPLVRK